MAKGINIKVGADTKEAESRLDKITKKLNTLGKSNAAKGINNLNGAVNVMGKAFGVAVEAAKRAVAVIKDLHAAALKQIEAEQMLASAAKNNPYLNSENVKALKDYASELQGIGTVGDEELLPMMARLAAAGRTQQEIQDIMSASLDMSAAGVMSMDSAVDTLNKTYSGQAGLLTRTLPAVKGLTAEQLKHGEAVKVVAEQYKGMAKSVADTTGYPKKLSNAWGDLKEQLG